MKPVLKQCVTNVRAVGKGLIRLSALVVLAASLAFSHAGAQTLPFKEALIFTELVRSGVGMNAKLAVMGVPKSDLQTSAGQRDAIDAHLTSFLPPDFRYLSRNQLQRVAALIGGGDKVSDDIWANIQSDAPDVVGLVFFDPTSVQELEALVTPRIVLRDGQTIVFDAVSVPLPENSYEIRLEALLAQFANRVAGISPSSQSVFVGFEQEGLEEKASSFRDCRKVFATLLKKEIAQADNARLSGEHRSFKPEDQASVAVYGHLATEEGAVYVGLEAPSLGLFEPIQNVKLSGSCVLAKAGPKCKQGRGADGKCLPVVVAPKFVLPTEDTIEAWQNFLNTCNGCEYEQVAQASLARLMQAEKERQRAAERERLKKQDADSWAKLQADRTFQNMSNYLNNCNAICAHRKDATDAIAQLNKEAERKRKEQAQLEELKADDQAAWAKAASADKTTDFLSYLTSCNSVCAHRQDATNAILQLKKKAEQKRQELAKLEELKAADQAAWSKALSANTTEDFLSYINSCNSICAHKAEATEAIVQQGREAEKKQQVLAQLTTEDEQAWQAAEKTATSGAYQRYIDQCNSVCAFKTTAEDRIQNSKQVAKAKFADFDAWRSALSQNTIESFSEYVSNCKPPCNFKKAAEIEIEKLEEKRDDILKSMSEKEKWQYFENELALTKDDIKKLQIALNGLGYDTGSPDGVIGRKTRSALSKYQQQLRGRPTGYFTFFDVNSISKKYGAIPSHFNGRWRIRFERYNPAVEGEDKTQLGYIMIEKSGGINRIIDAHFKTIPSDQAERLRIQFSEGGYISIKGNKIGYLINKMGLADYSVQGHLPEKLETNREIIIDGKRLDYHSAAMQNWLRLKIVRISY